MLLRMNSRKLMVAFSWVLIFSNTSYSQACYPIPQDSTSEWRIWISQWDPFSYVSSYDGKVFVSCDTMIDENIYSKLLYSGLHIIEYQGVTNSYPFEDYFYALIRTDSARTWVHLNGQDELLYDFSLQPGDTLPETLINRNTVVVSSVDSVVAGDKYLRRFNIYDSINGDLISNWYIEGIGHEHGLIEPMYMMLDNGYWLECYAEYGTPVFPEGSECDLAVNIHDKISAEISINVYPSPSSGLITIALNSDSGRVVLLEVYSAHGEIIFYSSWNVKQGLNKRTVDLFPARTGIYFAIIRDGSDFIHKKFSLTN